MPDADILCILVPGDFDGLGETRKRELVKACNVLGVKEVSACCLSCIDYQYC